MATKWIDGKQGKWRGGRCYFDDAGKRVFVIEAMRQKVRYSINLKTHDEEEAGAELALFERDPAAYAKASEPAPVPVAPEGVYADDARITRYMESIRHTVIDHQKARRSYLVAWGEKAIDLRTVERQTLRAVLASFDGGHDGRTEALNAFARFLVKEGDLPAWNPLVNTHDTDPELARAERRAYSVKELKAAYDALTSQAVKDLFLLRCATGMHHTELAQLENAQLYRKDATLPEGGSGIRKLGGKHEIQGVLQVMHKSRHRHRQSVSAKVMRAALRLREHVPSRITVWKALEKVGIVPSNLRHTFITLAGEIGERVTYKAGGVDRSLVAQVVGHRAGSTMTADRYEKLQVPIMISLPPIENWNVL